MILLHYPSPNKFSDENYDFLVFNLQRTIFLLLMIRKARKFYAIFEKSYITNCELKS